MSSHLHHEDIKAELRKRFGSVHAFALQSGLGQDAVTDLFRGRTSARVAQAIADALGIEVSRVWSAVPKGGKPSGKPDDNRDSPDAHRLSAEAR